MSFTDLLWELVSFLSKGIIFVIVFALICFIIVVMVKSTKDEQPKEGSTDRLKDIEIKVVDLKEDFSSFKKDCKKELKGFDKYEKYQEKLSSLKGEKIKDKKKTKAELKQEKIAKLEEKIAIIDKKRALIKDLEQKGEFCPYNLFVIDFDGDTKGSSLDRFTLLIDTILSVATSKDELVIRLTSPGGLVNIYGLLSSQMERVRKHGIKLVSCVDKVAASGGYLMACVSDKIVAAPFSYIGSIGVVASMPNFNRLLDKKEIDYEQITAGKYKRTLTLFGKNTDEGREKFKEDLELIHKRFKEQIIKYRKNIDIENVATGEHWLALDAKELNLVDEIATSEEYIQKRMAVTYNATVRLYITDKVKSNFLQKLIKRFTLASKSSYILNNMLKDIDDENTTSFIR